METESLVGLAALEAQYLALREVPADLDAAFNDAFAQATGGTSGSPLLHALRQAGHDVAAAIRTTAGQDLPYHNPHHFAEATRTMGRLCAIARDCGAVAIDDAAMGVVAMIGHDIGHDGVSIIGGALEARAAAATLRMARAAGVGGEALARIADVIEGTDPAALEDNEARSAGRLPPGPFGITGDRLRSLANEADVTGSLMPTLGLHLGELLARERREAADPTADLFAGFAGRLGFLRHHTWFTPAATVLGLAAIVAHQVDVFARVARALGAGATPEAGAAALDRIDRDEARAKYLAEVSVS